MRPVTRRVVALADSLLSAIVRADGDALVMHVGERPYVVVGTQTINISTHGLNLNQMIGMLAQLVPAEFQSQLDEFGAVECQVPFPGTSDRFSVVAARGGDDVWIEIRRRRAQPTTSPAPAPVTTTATTAHVATPPPVAEPAPVAAETPVAPAPVAVEPEPVSEPTPEPIQEQTPEPIPEPVAHVAPDPVSQPEPSAPIEEAPAVVPEPVAVVDPIPVPEPPAIPEPTPETGLEPAAMIAEPEPVREPEPQPEPAVEHPLIAARAPVVEHLPVATPAPIAASASADPGVPMTRTVRIEVPPRAPAATARPSAFTTDIERLLHAAAARGASQLFLTSESRPWIRVEGDVRQLESEPAWSRADVERTIIDIVPESGQEAVARGEATEWLSEFADVGRIRCNTFVDHRGPGILLRMVASRAATAEQLGLSRDVQAFATEAQGVVIVGGPRGSGKSTLISALVDLANRQRAEFVITVERQIRFIHDSKAALVSQRESRGGAEDAVAAVRAALREGPDVLVVDDLISSQMVPLLTEAASEGVLVLASIAASSTTDAIGQFVELAPAEMRGTVQKQLAESFRGAIAQLLVKKTGGGMTAVREVMLATAPVARAIGEGQLNQLPLTFDSGRQYGMVALTDPLVELVRAGAIDVRDAYRKTPERDRLVERLKRHGFDTSAVERLG
jgi:twitching motility protein PilT